MSFIKKNEENDDITREHGRSDIVSLDIFESDNSTTDLVHIPHQLDKRCHYEQLVSLLLSKLFSSL